MKQFLVFAGPWVVAIGLLSLAVNSGADRIADSVFAEEHPAAAETAPSYYSFSSYPDGVHHLAVTIRAGEVVSIGSLRLVVLSPPTTTPTVPDDPTTPSDPGTPDPLEDAVADLVASAPSPKNEREAIARLYETVGGLPVETVADLQTATDTLYGALPLDGWDVWKGQVDELAAGKTIKQARRIWNLIGSTLK